MQMLTPSHVFLFSGTVATACPESFHTCGTRTTLCLCEVLNCSVGESGETAGSAETRRSFRAEIDLSTNERYDIGGDGDFDDPNPF